MQVASVGGRGRVFVCSEVLFRVGWNLDNEIFMDVKSWKAPREVAWAGPRPPTVLSVAK